MSDHSAWTDPDVLVQWWGVGAAILAGLVVGWQAWLTRKALAEAEKSRGLAEESLELARADQERTTIMAIEAVKTRIAINAPSIDVAITKVQPARYAARTSEDGLPEVWPPDHVFGTEKGNVIVMVRAEVRVTNTGQRTTRVTLHNSLREIAHGALGKVAGAREGPDEILLQPDQHFDGVWELSRTVADWVRVYNERGSPGADDEADLEVYVDDGQDTGASYAFAVTLGGTALIPEHPGLSERWVLAGEYGFGLTNYQGIGPGRRPTRTIYWLSKLNSIPLPEVKSIPMPNRWRPN